MDYQAGFYLLTTAGILIPGGKIVAAYEAITNWEDLTSSIEVEGDELVIEGPGLFNNNTMTYKLDGWAGRYSMPLEFLLATHIATMAPDLSYKMATTLNTELEMLIHEVSGGDIDAAIQKKGDDSSRVTRTELAEKNHSIWTNVWDGGDLASLSHEEVLSILQDPEINIDSYTGDNQTYKCTGPEGDEVAEVISEFSYDTSQEIDISKISEEDKKQLLEKFDELMGTKDVMIDVGNIKSEIESTFWTTESSSTNNSDNNNKTQENNKADKTIQVHFKVGRVDYDGHYELTFEITIGKETKKIQLNGDIEEKNMETTDKMIKYILTELGKKIESQFNIIVSKDSIDKLVSGEVKPNVSLEFAFSNDEQTTFNLFGGSKEESTNNNSTTTTSNVLKPTDANTYSKIIEGKYKDKEVSYTLMIYLREYNSQDVDNTGENVDRTNSPYAWKWYLSLAKANKVQDPPITECSDPRNTANKACEGCYNYVKHIYKVLNMVKETDLHTYVPYINCVRNHWFRNVYFTKAAINKDHAKIVETDDQYEKQTGERWTLYKTYSGESGAVEKSSDYKLYLYVPDASGNYDNDKSTKFYQSGDGYVLCKEVEKGEKGNYKLSDDGVTYVPDDNGNCKLVLDKEGYPEYTGEQIPEFRVGKMAETVDLNEVFKGKDSTYEFGQTSAKWQTYSVTDSTAPDIKELDSLDLELLYKSNYQTVIQTEDGVRGETNAEIKKLFLDDYYLYDGSTERAKLIETAKSAVRPYVTDTDDFDDPDTYRKYLGEKIPSTTYTDKDDKVHTIPETTLDDISGPISLTHNSLTAFSMLRNMKTLDAEYIYHDFKELIVELDYFDKEDLVEPEDEVMMFPVSEVLGAGWPDARYDKKENYNGTLIHSAADYQALRAETAAELAEIMGNEVEEDDEAIEQVINANENNTNTDNLDYLGDDDSSDIPKVNSQDSLLVQAAKDIMKYMQEHNYEYSQEKRASSFSLSQNPGYGYVDCSGFVSWCLQECGIFDEEEMTWSGGIATTSKLVDYYHNSSVSDYAVDLEPGTIVIYSGHVSIYAGTSDGTQTGEPIFYDAGSTNCIMQSPRDISGWHPEKDVVGYIYIPNDKLTYQGVAGSAYLSQTDIIFGGYQGGEAVVAPVTGKVLKYGTIKREKIETVDGENTTPGDEEVGYIKIQVPDQGTPDQGCTYFAGNKADVSDDDGNNYKDGKLSASDWLDAKYTKDSETWQRLGYDYFWEEYNDAGITGHILYLEGFDISKITTGTDDKGQNIQDLKNYIESDEAANNYGTQYRVPNLLDDKREFELQVAEQAKKNAIEVFEKDGEIYIKEGSVIGYTYTTDEAKAKGLTIEKTVEGEKLDAATSDATPATTTQTLQVGNYLRMILRKQPGDDVVENVEEYVENGGIGSGVATEFPEKFLFWEGIYVEGGIDRDGDYYKATTGAENGMNDGKTTTAFGLTEDCQGTAEELGYNNYKNCLVNDKKVPVQMAQDIFIGEMEADRQVILSKVSENNLTESALDALVSIYHNSPTRALNLCNQLNSQTSNLTQADFEAQWGSNTSCEAALRSRRRGEYLLYSEEKYPAVYDGEPFKCMKFTTETPWTDFCEGKDNAQIFEWEQN